MVVPFKDSFNESANASLTISMTEQFLSIVAWYCGMVSI
jgi:hypothetical protein